MDTGPLRSPQISHYVWALPGGSSQLVSGWQPPLISHLGHLEGEQPYLGDLLTMVVKRLLTGMILQVPHVSFRLWPNSCYQMTSQIRCDPYKN